MPVAQQFIIIGLDLKEELTSNPEFNEYFLDKSHRLKFIDEPSQIDINPNTDALFIIRNFEGEVFSYLLDKGYSIMGSIALLQSIRHLESTDEFIDMVHSERPLHNLAMHTTQITIGGIKDKKEAQNLLTLVRYMGARSHKDVNKKTTHLVAGSAGGSKYKLADKLGLPIMSKQWVYESFKRAQKDLTFEASDIVDDYRFKSMPTTARKLTCDELLKTERNYVGVLDTIIELFKNPLEQSLDTATPILPATGVKLVFGNLIPIHHVHKQMLSQLVELIEGKWDETNCIGKVFVAHSIELLKAYPPFVNFLEDTKKTIKTFVEKYPRFHTFLEECQSKPACNRESLIEMLIRPVQRLPSISLLLNELIKRTDESNPDKKYLTDACESIRRVMNLINEDKRKTESQIAMFNIVNSIEDCPPNLLSALRQFVCKVEARFIYMNGDYPARSQKVVLILFTDLIEICKIRSLKRSHSSKSERRAINPNRVTHERDYRHMDELHLCDVIKIVKKCQSPGMGDAFVIQARPNARFEQNFRYYPLVIDDGSSTKSEFIEKLENRLIEFDYTSDDLKSISNEEIDFSFAHSLIHSIEKSKLKRVLSLKQSLLSPSLKSRRNHFIHHDH